MFSTLDRFGQGVAGSAGGVAGVGGGQPAGPVDPVQQHDGDDPHDDQGEQADDVEMASTVPISTRPTSCTPPAIGAAIRMPFAHRRWSLSPSTGSRSRMAVPSWCSTTT